MFQYVLKKGLASIQSPYGSAVVVIFSQASSELVSFPARLFLPKLVRGKKRGLQPNCHTLFPRSG